MALDRRQFVKLTVLFTGVTVTGAVGALASACSSDTTPTTGPAGADAAAAKETGTPVEAGGSDAAADAGGGTLKCRESITQNHGHSITVPVEDLDSTTSKTYSIKGTSPHNHNVVLEAADFAQLKSGLSVKKTSDNGGETHDHDVTILCAKL